MTKTSSDRQFVNALARGLEVLRCFGPVRGELSVTEISRITGDPQPTVWRLCHTLVELGYLTRIAGSEKLTVGIPCLTLGYAVLNGKSFGELALQYLQRFCARFDGTILLCGRDGLDMVYLQRCLGTSPVIPANTLIGGRVPIFESATGWAYVAGARHGERNDLFEAYKQHDPAGATRVIPRLKKAMSDYDRTGWILALGAHHPDINSVGVPVRSPDGKSLYAISCGGLSSSFTPARLTELAPSLVDVAAVLGGALDQRPAATALS